MKKVYECGLDGLENITNDISKALREGGVLLLIGTLASGKTTLVKSVAKKLGIEDAVSSPTFSLMQSYDDAMFHYDIYQCGLDGFLKQGLLEHLGNDGVHVVEWADDGFIRLLDGVGVEYIVVRVEIVDENKRRYEVTYA